MATIICPKCGHFDQLQKVSSVRETGIASGTGQVQSMIYMGDSKYVPGYEYEHWTSVTELAKLFAPPDEPTAPKDPSDFTDFEQKSLYFALVLPFIMFACVLCIVSFAAPQDVLSNIFLPKGGISFQTILVPLLLIALALSPVLILYAIYFSRNKDWSARYKVWYAAEKPRWDNAMRHWNRAYYCRRDGIVFDPETNEYCEPSNFQHFLYRI